MCYTLLGFNPESRSKTSDTSKAKIDDEDDIIIAEEIEGIDDEDNIVIIEEIEGASNAGGGNVGGRQASNTASGDVDPEECIYGCQCTRHFIGNEAFEETVISTIDDAIEEANNSAQDRVQKYIDENWGGIDIDQNYKDYLSNAASLTRQKAVFSEKMKELCEKKYHSDGLVLAAVVYNEAAASSFLAKKAVAYAYMNRTKGYVRVPQGLAISHYTRRNFLTNTSSALSVYKEGKYAISTWLPNLNSSIEAAIVRLDAANKSPSDAPFHHYYPLAEGQADLASGGNHWYSLYGLTAEGYVKRADGSCAKGVKKTFESGVEYCVPSWSTDSTPIYVSGVKYTSFVFFNQNHESTNEWDLPGGD